jgi:hypothetical protein
VRLGAIAELSGLGRRGMQRALSSISVSGLAQLFPAPKAGLISFRTAGDVLSTSQSGSFYFPGSLVAEGTWASLTAGERCVLVAIASAARRLEWNHDTRKEESRSFLQWLDSYGALETLQLFSDANYDSQEAEADPDEAFNILVARRVARLTDVQLAASTGMHASSVSRSVIRLVNGVESLLAVYDTLEERQYLLPPASWGDSASRVHALQYGCCETPRWVAGTWSAFSDGDT